MARLCQSTDMKLRLRGEVIVRVYKGGRLLETHRTSNMVVDTGLEYIAELLAGLTAVYPNYVGVGTNGDTPLPTDTALREELGRVEASERSREGATAIWLAWFGADSTFNGEWRETGLYTSSTGGTLIARAVFPSPIQKDESKTVSVEWRITLSRG